MWWSLTTLNIFAKISFGQEDSSLDLSLTEGHDLSLQGWSDWKLACPAPPHHS